MKTAIGKGLHARLASRSFVTGQLYVDLYFDPDEEIRLVGGDPATPEIPTSQSKDFATVFSNVPMAQISNSLLKVLDDVDRTLASPAIPKMFDSFAVAGQNVAQLSKDLDRAILPLIARAGDSLTSLDHTLNNVDSTVVEIRGTFASAHQLIGSDVRDAFVSARAAGQQADKMLANAGTLVSRDSEQRYDIDRMLHDLSAMARSLRAFSDEIDRKPNSIVLGK